MTGVCKTVVTRNRKKTHVTITVEADAEDFEEIRTRLQDALRKCEMKPSYSISKVAFIDRE